MDILAATKLKHGSPVWVWHTDLGPDVEGRWRPGTVLEVLSGGGGASLWVFLESMESIAAPSIDAERRDPHLKGRDKPQTTPRRLAIHDGGRKTHNINPQ
jgi:hypothetical protein